MTTKFVNSASVGSSEGRRKRGSSDPDGLTTYVANWLSGTVTPIATATNTAGEAIKLGNSRWRSPSPPGGRQAYVVNSGSGTVTPIRTATGTTGKPIKVGYFGRRICAASSAT